MLGDVFSLPTLSCIYTVPSNKDTHAYMHNRIHTPTHSHTPTFFLSLTCMLIIHTHMYTLFIDTLNHDCNIQLRSTTPTTWSTAPSPVSSAPLNGHNNGMALRQANDPNMVSSVPAVGPLMKSMIPGMGPISHPPRKSVCVLVDGDSERKRKIAGLYGHTYIHTYILTYIHICVCMVSSIIIVSLTSIFFFQLWLAFFASSPYSSPAPLSSASVAGRLERERQALLLLSHYNHANCVGPSGMWSCTLIFILYCA